SFSLSSFYLLLATSIKDRQPCLVPGYAGVVLQSQIHFSSLATITLACRKSFDHGKGLTGAAFGRLPDSAISEHAKYWSSHGRSFEDALRALRFLRSLFSACSQKPDALFKSKSTLG